MSAHSLLLQTPQQAVRVAPAPRASWRMAATVAGLLLTGGRIGAQVAGGETGSLAALRLPWVDAERVGPGGGRTAPRWPMRSMHPRCGIRSK